MVGGKAGDKGYNLGNAGGKGSDRFTEFRKNDSGSRARKCGRDSSRW